MNKQRTHLLMIGLWLTSLHAGRADWQIWTLTDTRHVLRGDAPGAHRAVELSAARNEWVSFQILMRSDSAVQGINIVPAKLKGPDGTALAESHLRLYRQHQLPLETGTYRNETFVPDAYPDPLIPFEHPMRGPRLSEVRIRAVPFDLAAGQTHGFWVDLCVPADAAPGKYRGDFHVTAEDQTNVIIPVQLEVWDFALPETPTLVTALGSPAQRMRGYYRERAQAGREPEPSDWEAVEVQCAQMLSQHRINATPSAEWLQPQRQDDGTFAIPSPRLGALREFVDRYHVNALQVPHPSGAVKDPEVEKARLHAWLKAFDRAARELDRPQVIFFTYLKDEPNTREEYRYVQQWGRAVRAAQSAVKVMVVEQTWTEPGQGGADSAWGDLYGAVDIWCPLFSLHRPERAAQRRALGETLWTYTALCQGQPTPWWHIDSPLLNYRVPGWMAWRDHINGLLYWGGLAYWRQVDDPWVEAPYYTGNGRPQQGRQGIVFHGEGSLVYPARAVGYDGIVPTIRLKALRDGIEDYEYLVLAEKAGRAEQAREIVKRLTTSWFEWDEHPGAYDQARAELASLIQNK